MRGASALLVLPVSTPTHPHSAHADIHARTRSHTHQDALEHEVMCPILSMHACSECVHTLCMRACSHTPRSAGARGARGTRQELKSVCSVSSTSPRAYACQCAYTPRTEMHSPPPLPSLSLIPSASLSLSPRLPPNHARLPPTPPLASFSSPSLSPLT